MRVKFTAPFDYVTLRTKSGTPRATIAYGASDEPQTVKREHGEAAVEAGKATEVKEPHKRVDKPGKSGPVPVDLTDAAFETDTE